MATVEVSLDNLLEERRDVLNKLVEDALFTQIKNVVSWSAEEKIREATKKFCEETVAPEIAKYLDENKVNIIAQVKTAVDAAFAKASEGLTKKAVENLSSSWNVQKVLDAMFK